MSPNQHAGLFRFLFIEDSVKIKKDLELFSRPYFAQNSFIKNFTLNVTCTDQISLPECVYFLSYSIKCVLCFMLRRLMTS